MAGLSGVDNWSRPRATVSRRSPCTSTSTRMYRPGRRKSATRSPRFAAICRLEMEEPTIMHFAPAVAGHVAHAHVARRYAATDAGGRPGITRRAAGMRGVAHVSLVGRPGARAPPSQLQPAHAGAERERRSSSGAAVTEPRDARRPRDGKRTSAASVFAAVSPMHAAFEALVVAAPRRSTSSGSARSPKFRDGGGGGRASLAMFNAEAGVWLDIIKARATARRR